MRPSEIWAILDDLSVTPRKRRGQNFLTDDRVADREVGYAEISTSDIVLEIGPGLGVLTERLIPRARKVIGIESDPGLCRYLRQRFGESLELIEGDALKIVFPSFSKLVSNIPYGISSPLIFKLLDHRFETAVIMIQKEFAERLVARPNTDGYSRLTVNAYYRARCEILEHVPSSRFWPEPEVDSSIVRLYPMPPPFEVADEALFFALVDALFQQRRKKISTVLRSRGWIGKATHVPYGDLRVEALSPEQIGEVSNAVEIIRTGDAGGGR